MNKLFNNILVPVDFSDVSELAIEKAIDIANHFKCNIHLVVADTNSIGKRTRQFNKSINGIAADAEAMLYRLQNKFTFRLHPGLSIQSSLRKGTGNRAVIEYTLRHNIDLIIIGRSTGVIKKLMGSSYDIVEITKHIECPVLTVRMNTSNNQWMNIVLPVCSMLPVRKIMFACYLARKYNSKIHLLSIAGDEIETDIERNQYLYKAYQLLRDNTNLVIECHTIRGHNIAESTLRFAQKINADLIVVNTGQESRLSGFVNKIFDGSLFSESKIPVMSISAV
ncbi:MAG: universal stress protein [Chitinophagaceae bacterium]|nr:universal stress protein [Chitinophagaceae bacterium]